MIPSIAEGGKSFQGALAYYLHDRNAATQERVGWTDSVNLASRDVGTAWKEMAFTALHQGELKRQAGIKATGRKLEKPVYAYSLSWDPDERPTHAEMGRAARETLQVLGMGEHQAVLAVHTDTPHPHIHVIVNRVHPETGKVASTGKDRLKLSKWAEAYEREQGQVRVQGRVANNARRRQGEFVVDRQSRERDRAQFADWRQERQRQARAKAMQAQYRQAAGQREQAGESLKDRLRREQASAESLKERLAREQETGESLKERLQREASAAGAMRDQYRQAAGWREEAGRPGPSGQARQTDRPQDRTPDKREQARERARFETWANARRAERQNDRLEAAGQMDRRHEMARQALTDELEAFYGPGRDKAQAALSGAQARLERGGMLYRLSGRAQDDRQTVEAAKQMLQDIAQRSKEREGRLEAAQAREREVREVREQAQDRQLEQGIERARARREAEGWRRQEPQARQAGQERANDNSGSRDRGRGRERSRDFGWER